MVAENLSYRIESVPVGFRDLVKQRKALLRLQDDPNISGPDWEALEGVQSLYDFLYDQIKDGNAERCQA